MRRSTTLTVIDTRPEAKARVVRKFAILISIRATFVAALDFLMIGVLAPNLVDLHKDWALVGAVICLAAALLASVWLAFQLVIDLRRFGQALRQISRLDRMEQNNE